MSESARAMLELLDRGWVQLTPDERALFEDWAKSVQGVDVYTLLRFARRKWQRGASSSSQTLAAQIDTERPTPVEDEK